MVWCIRIKITKIIKSKDKPKTKKSTEKFDKNKKSTEKEENSTKIKNQRKKKKIQL